MVVHRVIREFAIGGIDRCRVAIDMVKFRGGRSQGYPGHQSSEKEEALQTDQLLT
jgi:hypothetical protein